jgi:chaperonin GroEL
VVRHLERVFTDHIEPTIRQLARKLNPDKEADAKLLQAVARVSGNGDEDLAKAVMECFAITGDSGNVTIQEMGGPSGYKTEQIKGYSIPMGYDQSCGKWAPVFITNQGTQMVSMEKPLFLLYHGAITEIQTIKLLMEKVGLKWANEGFNHNVVVAAVGFSDSVLAQLAANFREAGAINVFPLVIPQNIQANSQLAFLQDLQAITGANILDPVNSPAEVAEIEDLGPGVDLFECSRTRASVIGNADEDLLNARIEELEEQLKAPESDYDEIMLRERLAKVSGGIAKLNVIGSSNGETKEKRDRAEDAVCAVRGAIKHGCLPGGAWTLLKLCHSLPRDQITDEILRKALIEPFNQLLSNCGIMDATEAQNVLGPILVALTEDKVLVYDFLEGKHVDPYVDGILDSTPAVLEAIRNSISIASLHGTLGGVVSFARDHDLERSEAQITSQFLRDSNVNEANERP